jgi:RNA polymerase sigma-70 factor (ECF subfamily)
MNTPISKTTTSDALATTLLANLGAFQSFARKRLHDEHLAADAVQESLLRALQAAPGLTHDKNLLAWFYRILRNVLTDLHRRSGREREKVAGFQREAEGIDAEAETIACACLRGILPTLKPEYADAIQRLDLNEESPAQAADTLGVSRNTLKVRLHRARRQLRSRLEQTCKTCATHGCLDCTCAAAEDAK